LYHDPYELSPLIEEEDYSARNVFFYFAKYDMMTILQTNIMDRFLTDKWFGRLDTPHNLSDFSSSYSLIMDKF
jgi:hypothetical protein